MNTESLHEVAKSIPMLILVVSSVKHEQSSETNLHTNVLLISEVYVIYYSTNLINLSR